MWSNANLCDSCLYFVLVVSKYSYECENALIPLLFHFFINPYNKQPMIVVELIINYLKIIGQFLFLIFTHIYTKLCTYTSTHVPPFVPCLKSCYIAGKIDDKYDFEIC